MGRGVGYSYDSIVGPIDFFSLSDWSKKLGFILTWDIIFRKCMKKLGIICGLVLVMGCQRNVYRFYEGSVYGTVYHVSYQVKWIMR